MENTTLQNTTDLIRTLLVEGLEVEPEEIRPDAEMGDILPDSLMRVDLAVQIQEQLGLKIADQDLKDLTFLDFVAQVDGLRGA